MQLTLTQMQEHSPTAQVQPCMAAAWTDLASMVRPWQHGQLVEKYGAMGMVQEQRCGRGGVWLSGGSEPVRGAAAEREGGCARARWGNVDKKSPGGCPGFGLNS